MVTDINDLEKYLGKYIDIAHDAYNPETKKTEEHGASGFVVSIGPVEHAARPTRYVAFDWGMGWPVTDVSRVTETDPPPGYVMDTPDLS